MQAHSAVKRYTLQAGGFAAIGMALCYISMALIFFGLVSIPTDIDVISRIRHIQQQYTLVAWGYGSGYLLFGVLLAVLLQALKQALPDNQYVLAELADRFGAIWLMLMMAAGMTVLIGLDQVFKLLARDPLQAQALYHANNMLSHALGGGIELVGGLWCLLFSLAGLAQRILSKALHRLGILVGCLGILTVLHTLPYLKDAFGLLQMIWFIWLGVALWRMQNSYASR